MKIRKKELNVDFIVGFGPLKKEDKKAFSDFIKARKVKAKKKLRVTKRKNARA